MYYNNRNKRGHKYYKMRGRYICNDLYTPSRNLNRETEKKYYDNYNATRKNYSYFSDDSSEIPISDIYEILKELNYLYDFSPLNYRNKFSSF